jgi:hypothetical protein
LLSSSLRLLFFWATTHSSPPSWLNATCLHRLSSPLPPHHLFKPVLSTSLPYAVTELESSTLSQAVSAPSAAECDATRGGRCGCGACRLDVSVVHARPLPLYKYVRASCKHVPHASALFSNQTISCIHAALLACVFFLLNRPFLSFSSPLLVDLPSSSDSVVAVRVVVRSLGLCRSGDAALGMLDGHRAAAQAEGVDAICYSPQTPQLARACVGTVSAVAFEVWSTCAKMFSKTQFNISFFRQLPIPTPYKCPPCRWPRWTCS